MNKNGKITINLKDYEDEYRDKDEEVLCIIQYALDQLKESDGHDQFTLTNDNKWTHDEVIEYIKNSFKEYSEFKLFEFIKEQAKKHKYNPDEDPVLQDFRKKMRKIREGG